MPAKGFTKEKTDRLTSDAITAGYELIERIDYSSSRYRCMKCGTIVVAEDRSITGRVKRGKLSKVRCSECANRELALCANKIGLMLHKGVRTIRYPTSYVKVSCIKCGYSFEAHRSGVRKCETICKNCIRIKHQGYADKEGLVLVGYAPAKDKSYRLWQHTCGTLFEATVSSVKNGEVMCPGCNDNGKLKPHSMYVLSVTSCNNTVYKVGISGNVHARLVDLNSGDSSVEFVCSIALPNFNKAKLA